MDLRPWAILIPTLIFAFMNGASDSGTMAASVVSSRNLQPRTAVVLAAIASFLGAMLLGSAVARMLGEGLLVLNNLNASVSPFSACVAAVMTAVAWGMLAWRFGLPASYTHSLLGGWLGGFVALGGIEVLQIKNVLLVLAAVFLTPFVALFSAWIGLRLLYWAASELTLHTKFLFKAAESLLFVAMSFAHGANAAQKSMALLVLGGLSLGQKGPLPVEFFLPVWVQVVCATAFSSGVLLGFTRTLKKVGFGIFRVETLPSLCALASAGALTMVSTVLGLPLSSGQINTSALMGAGAGHNFRAVRWDVAAEFFANWMLTLPCTGVMAFLLVKLVG